MAENDYEVLWPRGQRISSEVPYAARLETLNGKTVCALWDFLFRGDEVFPIVEAELKKRFPEVRFVSYEAFGNIHGLHNDAGKVAALANELKNSRCDAVICGLGC
jgi:hypothetical protein